MSYDQNTIRVLGKLLSVKEFYWVTTYLNAFQQFFVSYEKIPQSICSLLDFLLELITLI